MKKALHFLSSRLFAISFIILLQFFWSALLLIKIGSHAGEVRFVLWCLSVIISIWLLNKWDNPAYKLAWIIPILMFPTFGGMLYLLFGNKEPTRRLRKKLEYGYALSKPLLIQKKEVRDKLYQKDIRIGRQSEYLIKYANCPVYENTISKYLESGEAYYTTLVEELKRAKKFIFLEFFIIEKGMMWDTILDILLMKIREGVEVRVIYDDVGCVTKLPYRYEKHLTELGIKCVSFNQFIPIFSLALNHRDHRKIVVIDGHTAFSGGINLADEYINEVKRFGHWKDTGIMIKGEAVWNFTVMFLQMWNSIIRTDSHFSFYQYHYAPDWFQKQNRVWNENVYATEEKKDEKKSFWENDGFVQPYGDSPLDQEIVGENVYLNLINQAKNYVYITTPYLIIDNEMMTALCLAAKRGVDIRIMTPGIPDKKLTFLLTESYYRQLIGAGVKIYEYTPGFLHAKMMISDDEVGTVGTINLDYRSLYLHFECGVFLYATKTILDIKEDMIRIMKVSHQVEEEECQKNWFQSLLQCILRVFAPLM
ncbi:MAG TPA: PLDc N-terminal domain-containing protein [Candidatus Scybalomonas excrementigallinarum]|nr:PLDc N-terminal domain-containing protein [Candidatus Scybalomonas excrementigallinarum]